MVEFLRPRITGEQIEKFRQILAESFATGKEAQITLNSRRTDIIVAGRQMTVPANAVRFLPDHQANLAMRFVTHEPVNNMSAHLLKCPGPRDVGFFIEPRLKLHQHRHLFA